MYNENQIAKPFRKLGVTFIDSYSYRVIVIIVGVKVKVEVVGGTIPKF